VTHVTLMSGGLDSTLVAYLLKEEGIEQQPLYVDYGQRNRDRELGACRSVCAKLQLREPIVAELGHFGRLVPSGLTTEALDLVRDAFLPGRNALLLLVAAAWAARNDRSVVTIGLLSESTSLFSDQTELFLQQARTMLALAVGKQIVIRAPLMAFTKREVVLVARERGIVGTYSCHLGSEVPCGRCISCREFIGTEV
jgi:7-cyano-7-deazaguanine synthase